MKITEVKTHVVSLHFRNLILIEIETDAGIVGLAETVMKRKTLSIQQSILELRRYLLGKDPTEIENHWEKIYRDSFWVGGPMHATAISAVDCALWDILAKSCNLPVFKLLGGPTRRRVPIYVHCPAGSRPEDFARNVRRCVEQGERAVKTTLPLFYGNDNHCTVGAEGNAAYSGTEGSIHRSWKETEYLDPSIFRRIREFFLAAREAVGPGFGIAVDCHGRLSLKAALRLCRALEDLDLLFVEEPVPPENVEILAALQRETSIPVAAGERWATLHGVRPFLEKQAVDLLQCDLVNCGGISGMRKIAALAEAHYISLAPHNPNGPLATAINLHFAASIPNFFILETVGSDTDRKLFPDIVRGATFPENGFFGLPGGPGFGVELNRSAFSRHPYVPHEGWR